MSHEYPERPTQTHRLLGGVRPFAKPNILRYGLCVVMNPTHSHSSACLPYTPTQLHRSPLHNPSKLPIYISSILIPLIRHVSNNYHYSQTDQWRAVPNMCFQRISNTI